MSDVFVNNLTVDYGPLKARFDRQISLSGLRNQWFGRHGDSGSLVLTEDFSPAALLFAVASDGDMVTRQVFANPLDAVLNALDVDIDLR